jgi:hypothetical protein
MANIVHPWVVIVWGRGITNQMPRATKRRINTEIPGGIAGASVGFGGGRLSCCCKVVANLIGYHRSGRRAATIASRRDTTTATRFFLCTNKSTANEFPYTQKRITDWSLATAMITVVLISII